MKKVGIATMTGGQNYGNTLQNYAVQEIISALGYEAWTLKNTTKVGFPDCARKPVPIIKKLMPRYIHDYRVVRLKQKYGCKNNRDCRGAGLRRAKNTLTDYRAAKKSREEKFARFVAEHLRFDTVAFDSKCFPREHLDTFYAFVCGSDQVWNPYFHTNSMIEFLQFAPEYKRIAFVPSFGISEIPDTRTYDYAQWLASIPHLSVREEAGARIIQELTGREAQVLLDPSFGLTRAQWLKFARKPKTAPKGKYVFCYFLGNEIHEYCRWIERYAEKHDCEIVEMFDIHSLRYYDIDPCEFVWLLANAYAVFTDSFHGTAFSVNMQVPFVAFERQEGGASMSSRITTLLNKTGLSNRVFSKMKDSDIQRIDFSEANEVVADERKRMFDYLSYALEQVDGKKAPLLANRHHCSGCGACANACPVEALKMVRDIEGFAYPVIDQKKCIGCGACERVCPAERSGLAPTANPDAFYVYSKELATVKASSSGGVFTELARLILGEKGLVFGAGFDDDYGICHFSVSSEQELPRLRTSKYVQSDTRQCYREVKKTLEENKPVLFTGTPCQVSALKRFLQKNYDKLYTADIICHGVPSPLVWEQYLQKVHDGKKIKNISFRDKTYGWNAFSMRVNYEDGSSYCELATKDPFVRAFLANLTLRPSCYQCQYKTLNRCSDLTLADYWGVETVHPELKEQQGVSLVLTHSERGRELLNKASSNLVVEKTDREKAVKMNHAALHSVAWHPKRNLFFSEFEKMDMPRLVKRCLKQPIQKRIRRIIAVNGSRAKKLIRKLRRK